MKRNPHPIRTIKIVVLSLVVTLPFLFGAIYSSGLVSWATLLSVGIGFVLVYVARYNLRGVYVVSQPSIPTSIRYAVDDLIYTFKPFVRRWPTPSADKNGPPLGATKSMGDVLVRSAYSRTPYPFDIQSSIQLSSSQTRFDFQILGMTPPRVGTGILIHGLIDTRPFFIERVDPKELVSDAKTGLFIALLAPLMIAAIGYCLHAITAALVISALFSFGMAVIAIYQLRRALRATALKRRLNLDNALILSHEGGWIALALGWLTPTTLTDDLAKRIDAILNYSNAETVVFFSAGSDRLILFFDLDRNELPESKILTMLSI